MLSLKLSFQLALQQKNAKHARDSVFVHVKWKNETKRKKTKKQKTKNKQTNKKNLIAFKCYYPSLISGSKRSVHEGKEKTRKLNMHLSQSPWPMTKKKNFWSPSSRKNVITTD